MTTFLIHNNVPVAYTDSDLKSGQWVRVGWHRQGNSIFNLINCKVSKAKKWLHSPEYINRAIDYAIEIAGDFYAGNDKPVVFVASQDDIEKSRYIQALLKTDKDYSKVANAISKAFLNKKCFLDLQLDLQISLSISASQADDILRLWLEN